jgi:solute carrier family 35 protein E1
VHFSRTAHARYLLNVKFNILNKQIYNIFPFPWFVSCVHLIVGLGVMSVFWVTKVVPFQKPDEKFIKDVTLPSFLHAFGHCLTNVSFAAVAVSFTHTVKTLEPVFSAAGSYLVTGTAYPLPVYLALLPIMAGVALASATELSFTWLGFSTAMASNVAFAGRAIFSKNLMNRMSAVNLYNYVTIVALLFCIPPTLYFEGASLASGLNAAAAKVGTRELSIMLFNVGLYYHLYNQVAYQALEKVEPITHAVGNVGKRIFVIGFSIIAFGNAITTQTAVGSAVAIAGALLGCFGLAQLRCALSSRDYAALAPRLGRAQLRCARRLSARSALARRCWSVQLPEGYQDGREALKTAAYPWQHAATAAVAPSAQAQAPAPLEL